MKRLYFLLITAALAFSVACTKDPASGTQTQEDTTPYDVPTYTDESGKIGNISYQLLTYTFADSDGDLVGDFNGIISKLDYLDGMGVSAIWISPAHPADSYHGYDVRDYNALDPKFGTEEDFRNLINAAHRKGIKIYMDYVLNHTGKGNVWFAKAKKSETAPEFSWFHISKNPQADIDAGKFPMINYYNSREWHNVTVGDLGYEGRVHFKVDFSGSTKTLTVEQSSAKADASNTDSSVNMFIWSGDPGVATRLYQTSANVYEITMDLDTPWGVLVRTSSTSWDNNTKWGAPKGKNVLKWGEPLALSSADAQDIVFNEPTDMKFQGAFGSWMPDINYGEIATAQDSGPFKAMVQSAKKWIDMGIDGFRLDAVKHIYSNESGPENPEFLKKWYDACNELYHQAGHTDDIYMVGEVWMDHNYVAPYYKGIPACFEFNLWDRLKWVFSTGTGKYLAKDLISYREEYSKVRSDAIAATILTNHDETRAATTLNKNEAQLKQAAAILMSVEGQPYIYQGEELGYWGTDSDDGGMDEMVRTPMIWDKASKAAIAPLNNKYDNTLLTDAHSVEAQTAKTGSLIRVYYDWTHARNSCKAIAQGKMSAHPVYNDKNGTFTTIAAWYMTASSGEKALVIHNTGSSTTISLPDDKLSDIVVSLGSVNISGSSVTLGANSSVVFQQ